jgi:replicative DNA helicase
VVNFADLLSAWEADAATAHEAYTTGIPRGAVTDLPKVDKELGGALSSGLHIVHGQPGAGKTAFVLQVAVTCGCPCLFVTCEMGPLELLRRIAARITSVFLGRIKSGELPVAESMELAKRAAYSAQDLSIVDATRAYASPAWLRDRADELRKDGEPFLIVLDSLHSWVDAGMTDGASETEALMAGLAALRPLAAQLSCPILAVCERNRASMARGGMNAAAGTRKIEYGAETVLDLARDPEDRPDAHGEVPVKLVFAKNRNGAAGKPVDLRFHGALQRFREV